LLENCPKLALIISIFLRLRMSANPSAYALADSGITATIIIQVKL